MVGREEVELVLKVSLDTQDHQEPKEKEDKQVITFIQIKKKHI